MMAFNFIIIIASYLSENYSENGIRNFSQIGNFRNVAILITEVTLNLDKNKERLLRFLRFFYW